MEKKHLKLKDRRQTKMLRIVIASKDSVDGLHPPSLDQGECIFPLPIDTGSLVAMGILEFNPYQTNHIRSHNLNFPRFNGENLKI